jgi:hypothetical protein
MQIHSINVCFFEDYFRIERYYEDIKDHTFETVVLPLSLAEAEELAKYEKHTELLHTQPIINLLFTGTEKYQNFFLRCAPLLEMQKYRQWSYQMLPRKSWTM